MTRVLFTDDEAPVLDGLRTRLYRQSGKWTMVFVESGTRALTEFEREPFDVIVTDMRMPGMDGAELLERVSERWPQTIRIVLSGYAEPQQALRLVPVAHQYLSKPCDAKRLVSAIERCMQLHSLLPHPNLRALAGRVRMLPVMPRVYAALRDLLTHDDATTQQIAELVTADPVISAKILQMATSAFFRLARPITNIDQAVGYLGIAAMRNLVTAPPVFTPLPERGAAGLVNFEELQARSHAAAAAAHALAADAQMADEALLAGLLHDIGYWLLAHEYPGDLAKAVEIAMKERIPLYEAEVRVIGASHAQVGAYLLGLWGLPQPVVDAVAHHHSPQSAAPPDFGPLAALAIALALLPGDESSAFPSGLVASPKVDANFLSRVNAPFDWDGATQRVAQIFEETEA